MEFTFGIITNNNTNYNVKSIISSIKTNNIPTYEIIIIGGDNIYDNDNHIIHVSFDESIMNGWITKKKNIICSMARYDNIVLLHDYIILDNGWYEGFLKFGNNFDICVSKIINSNNKRFRDYTFFPYGNYNPFSSRSLIPYKFPSNNKLSKLLYISGSYYIVKKHIANKFPLDERLCWADGEDVLFTKILITNNIIIQCNPYSTVKFLKQKESHFWETELTNEDILHFQNMTDEEIEKIHQSQVEELKRYIYQRKQLTINI